MAESLLVLVELPVFPVWEPLKTFPVGGLTMFNKCERVCQCVYMVPCDGLASHPGCPHLTHVVPDPL